MTKRHAHIQRPNWQPPTMPPTPEEIRARAAVIRTKWSKATRRERTVQMSDPIVCYPIPDDWLPDHVSDHSRVL